MIRVLLFGYRKREIDFVFIFDFLVIDSLY